MAYSEKVVEHAENPRNVGTLDVKDPNVGTGLVGAPACGDVMRLQIKVTDAGVIEDAKFKTFGCGSAIASSSLATEWLKGRTLDEAAAIRNTDIVQELNLPPVKIHCSVLAEDAIKSAIDDFRKKQAARRTAGADVEAQVTERAALQVALTPKAVVKAKEALKKRGTPEAMLRLGVRGGGCSGFSYAIEFADAQGPRDQVFEFDGLRVVVDPKSLVFLNGTTLDYEVKLMQHGFKFVNPNEQTGCGCGESFGV